MRPRLLVATVATALVAAAGLVLTASGSPAADTDPRGQGCDPPPQLETIRGSLERSGDGHVVAGDPVDFGAEWYLQRTTAPTDYDGDDRVETLAAERDGLVGQVVALDVDQPGRGGDRDVYAVNGTAYRSADGCPPQWTGGPRRDGLRPGPPPWAGGPDCDRLHAGPLPGVGPPR